MKMNEIPHNITSLTNLNNITNESIIAFEEKRGMKYKVFKCNYCCFPTQKQFYYKQQSV
jgi:hypothetical protein